MSPTDSAPFKYIIFPEPVRGMPISQGVVAGIYALFGPVITGSFRMVAQEVLTFVELEELC